MNINVTNLCENGRWSGKLLAGSYYLFKTIVPHVNTRHKHIAEEGAVLSILHNVCEAAGNHVSEKLCRTLEEAETKCEVCL